MNLISPLILQTIGVYADGLMHIYGSLYGFDHGMGGTTTGNLFIFQGQGQNMAVGFEMPNYRSVSSSHIVILMLYPL